MKKKMMVIMGACAALGFVLPSYAADIDTPRSDGEYAAVEAGEALPAGIPAGVWTNGLAYAAGTNTALSAVVGRVERAAAAGETAVLRRGVYRYHNGGGLLTDAAIGSTAYLYVDGTNAWGVGTTPVAASATNALGVITDVDARGVWVRIGF